MEEDLNENEGHKPPDYELLFNYKQQSLGHQISFSSSLFPQENCIKLEHFENGKAAKFVNPLVNLSIILKEDSISNPNQKPDMVPIQVPLTNSNQINVSWLVDKLKEMKFQLSSTRIFYFDQQSKAYIYCGVDPQISSQIPFSKIISNQLTLKYRQQSKSLLDRLFEEQKIQEMDTYGNTSQQKGKRVKERTIKEVVEKVALWRKIYSGFINEFGKIVQQPLDVSAKRIGISKKTLDDYLFQIRLGKKYGFDFNLNKDEKIGKLRAFVKDNRSKTEIQKRPRQQIKKEDQEMDKSY